MTQSGESYCERVEHGFARHPYWCAEQCGLCAHIERTYGHLGPVEVRTLSVEDTLPMMHLDRSDNDG